MVMPRGPRGPHRVDPPDDGLHSDQTGLAPWNSPTQFPPGPNNLPSVGQRPALVQPGMQAPINPQQQFTLERPFPVRDAHHYAYVTELVDSPSTVTSQLVLQQPPGFRNYLQLRNNSGGGQIVYVSFGIQASANSPLMLVDGQEVLLDTVVPQNDMYTFGSAVGASLCIAYSQIPPIVP